MENLGRVVLINGQADADNQVVVVKEQGGSALLQLNDVLVSGDTVITPKEIALEVQLANGDLLQILPNQVVKVTSDIADISTPDAGDSAVNQGTIKAVVQAVEEGRDFGYVLKEVSVVGDGRVVTENSADLESLLNIVQSYNPSAFTPNQDAASVTLISANENVLDLRDLLIDDRQGLDLDNLSSYLHFELVGEDTVVHINNSGGYAGGFVSAQDTQVITLAGVDLVTGFASDDLVIQDLLANNKLIVD
jgi:hypothetical protein